MLSAGVGKMFYVKAVIIPPIHLNRTSARLRGEPAGIVFDMHARFLGIDADKPYEIVWLFSTEWMEDGFPTCRIERFPDKATAKAIIKAIKEAK
jgi:hypothetical protein